jgi:hypothetical protein
MVGPLLRRNWACRNALADYRPVLEAVAKFVIMHSARLKSHRPDQRKKSDRSFWTLRHPVHPYSSGIALVILLLRPTLGTFTSDDDTGALVMGVTSGFCVSKVGGPGFVLVMAAVIGGSTPNPWIGCFVYLLMRHLPG